MIHASVRALERKAVQTLDFVAFWQDRLHENQGRCTCAHPGCIPHIPSASNLKASTRTYKTSSTLSFTWPCSVVHFDSSFFLSGGASSEKMTERKFSSNTANVSFLVSGSYSLFQRDIFLINGRSREGRWNVLPVRQLLIQS